MMGTRPRLLDLKMLYRRRPFVSLDLSVSCAGSPSTWQQRTLLGAALPTSARALIATCADGSVVFAKKWQDVHCSGAVEVAPKDVPQFGYVPRDRVAERRAFNRQHEAMRERDLEAQLAALPAVSAQARSTGPALPLAALSAAEYRDLARLVALSQERAAVAIERGAPPVADPPGALASVRSETAGRPRRSRVIRPGAHPPVLGGA